jgi:uncharacterized membrane protein
MMFVHLKFLCILICSFVEGNKCEILWTKWYNVWIIMCLLINSPSLVSDIIHIFQGFMSNFYILIFLFWLWVLFLGVGVRLSLFGTSATIWSIVPAPNDRWWMWSSRWNENWQGKPKYSDKTCPGATLFTTNPTWPDLGSNSSRRGEKLATNRLSYGTAIWLWVTSMYLVLAVFISQSLLASKTISIIFCVLVCLIGIKVNWDCYF